MWRNPRVVGVTLKILKSPRRLALWHRGPEPALSGPQAGRTDGTDGAEVSRTKQAEDGGVEDEKRTSEKGGGARKSKRRKVAAEDEKEKQRGPRVWK
jgi:hypothetical protein